MYIFISDDMSVDDHNAINEALKKDSVNVRLLCGADLLESFGTPGLWADKDVNKSSLELSFSIAYSLHIGVFLQIGEICFPIVLYVVSTVVIFVQDLTQYKDKLWFQSHDLHIN